MGKRFVLFFFCILFLSLFIISIGGEEGVPIKALSLNPLVFQESNVLVGLASDENLGSDTKYEDKESKNNDAAALSSIQIDEIIERNGTKYILRDGKEYALPTATYYIKFEPSLPSSVCGNEKINITVKGNLDLTLSPEKASKCLADILFPPYKYWVSFDLYIMEDDTALDDVVAVKYTGEYTYDCVSVDLGYYGKTFEDVDLSDWIIPDAGGNGEFYAKAEGDNIAEISTSSYDVYGYVSGECKCLSGNCCNLASRPYKYKSSGSQPTGISDRYDCEGTNSPTGTSSVKFINFYCSGSSSSAYFDSSTYDTCGTCEYCTEGDSTCNYYDSSTSCGSKNCNYLDTACRDYHDVNRYCFGTSGACNDATCNSYTNQPKGTSCGTGNECDGSGNCITCTSHQYFSCYDNDVYWFNKCDDSEDKKTECYSDGCSLWRYECKGKDVYNHGTLCAYRGCSNAACYSNSYPDEWKYVKTCEDVCVDGECKYIRCNEDSDCGNNDLIGNPFCQNDDVYWIYRYNYCALDGTIDSYCYYQDENKLYNDCGSDSCNSWGSNYCKGSAVYHSRTCYDKGCSNAACFSNSRTEEEKVKDCLTGCTNGMCNEDNCNNECSSGATKCSSNPDNFLQTCGNYDSDSCLDWPSSTSGSGNDNCNDCSCSCGGYNKNESSASSNCNDSRDNDCDGKIDGQDSGCVTINCSSDLQCGNPYWKNTLSCSNNDSYDYYVTPKCRNPGTSNSSCYNQEEFKLKQDCGDDSYSANYCNDNDVYRNFTDRGCLNGACFANTTKQKFQECGSAGCSNNKCNIACSINSDCGIDSWVGSLSCSNNDIFQNWRSFTCNNPGQVNANCSYKDQLKLKQDCGDDSNSTNFCYNNHVYRNFSDRGCLNGACFVNTTLQKVQDCGSVGCSNGKCNTSISWLNPISSVSYRKTTCAESNILIEDSEFAGLARKSSETSVIYIDGQAVSSCIVADFGSVYNIGGVRIRHFSPNNVCYDGCSSGYCNTGGTGKMFYSDEGTSWKYLAEIPRSTSFRWTNVSIDNKVRYVLICRSSDSYKRDNLQVDNIQISTLIYNSACSKNLDCGTNGWTGSLSCSNNDVFQNYRNYTCNNPGQANANCSYKDNLQLKQDCGEDSYSSNFCYNNSVYRNFSDRGCLNNACFVNTALQKVQDCGSAGCSNNKCNINTTCSSDSDCGVDDWIGATSCSNNDVFQNYRNYTCNNPGQANANCSYADSFKLKQYCFSDSCNNWGSNYCKSGNVYHNQTCRDRGCSSGACFSNAFINESLVQNCGSAGCSNGMCGSGITWVNPISGSYYRKTTCSENNILAEDSSYAGLARKSSETSVIYIDGQAVSSCIVADFNQNCNVKIVKIKHKSLNNVCNDGCSSGYCNTGGTGKMFYSVGGSSPWKYLRDIPRSTSFVWTNVSTNINTNSILICRSSDSYKRANLQVDNIQLGCA